jgi:hypothetical protein
MQIYETSATVEDHGQIHVLGLPFAPATTVEVTIREKVAAETSSPPANLEEVPVRMRELFSLLSGRNTEPVAPLRREELYDRKVFR